MHCRTLPTFQRRMCGLLLVAWLFAVLMGSARACLVVASMPVLPPQPAHELAHDHAGHEHDRHQTDSAHAACHKFCADEGQSLTKPVATDVTDFTPVLLPALLPAWVKDTASDGWSSHALHPLPQGPPLRTQLQRLAL